LDHTQDIKFQQIFNFRDLGGYKTHSGRHVAKRRVYRSGELSHATQTDVAQFSDVLRIKTILDLRNENEIAQQVTKPFDGLISQYFNVPFVTGENDDLTVQKLINATTDLSNIYLYFTCKLGYARQIVRALEIIAKPDHHPIVFHCSAGKDRTGVLAAILLDTLGVSNEDIMKDYTATGRWMNLHIARLSKNEDTAKIIREMPSYMHGSTGESMGIFLSNLHQEYGSASEYLQAHGADETLPLRLIQNLLL
jgi:protein-tyrosine phosphatase